MACELLQSKLRNFGFKSEWWPQLREATKGLSHAELMEATQDTMKQIIMDRGSRADATLVLGNLPEAERATRKPDEIQSKIEPLTC